MTRQSLPILLTTALLALTACTSSNQEQKPMPEPNEQPSSELEVDVAKAHDVPLEGTWQGPLKVPGAELTIVFHFDKTDDGTWQATMDSPDQGATGIPIDKVVREGDQVQLMVTSIGGVYAGTFAEDGPTISGTWTQGGASLPLDVKRVAKEEAKGVSRPQQPQPPFPYTIEEVTFDGGEPTEGSKDTVKLSGTLTLPKSKGPHPAIVLLTGSGPQDRDETLAGHKPFLVLADHLSRHGVAVLRFDDRGVGKSTGTFDDATIADFTDDALGAVDYLSSRDDIDAEKIGLLGHSEGANVAPRAANASENVDFVVLLAPTAVPGHELLARQNRLIFEGLGMSAEGAQTYEKNMEAALQRILKVPADKPVPEEVRNELRADFEAAMDAMSPEDLAVYGVVSEEVREKVLDQLVGQLTMAWMRSFLAMTPAKTFAKLQVPTLALFGAKDVQVPPKQNAPVLEQSLSDETDATVEVLDGLNHLFQPAKTGLPAEYSQIATTLSPAALDEIADWLAERDFAQPNAEEPVQPR